MAKKDLLIEIYLEELPPSCIEEAKLQLKDILISCLNKFRVDYKDFNFYITPVRIVVLVEDVKEFTKKEIQEVIGPSVNIGIKNGEFTSAAVGFAKKNNVELKDLFIKDTPKGKFLAVKKILGGESFKSIINELFIDFISSFKFSKTMVWEDTRFRFPRPIRNLLVIYDNSFLKIKFASLTSSKFTFGIKTYPQKKLKISPHKKASLVDAYFDAISRECIILKQEERLKVLVRCIESIVSKKKLKYDKDPKLLNEITSIVEYPSCILCEFPESFLSLPKEFIITCMKAKQKFIPLYDENENITNKFIGVKNGYSEHLKYVKDGFEKVLIARLDDVKYYYEMDTKQEFISYFEKLKDITYNSKLSFSYYDKVINVKNLAKFLNKKLNFSIEEEKIELVSKLIKNDLPTQIVFEYPELQGIAGRVYCEIFCKKNNLPQDIALCCFEHYKPKDFDDTLPENEISILMALADKISTIIDNTIIDNLPTGSSDPLGLKKVADGIIKICLEKKIDLNLKDVLEFYCGILNTEFNENIYNKVSTFFAQRLESILLQQNFKIDEIRSILFNLNGEFYTKLLLINTLKSFRGSEEFSKLIELYKRVNNILQQARNKNIELDGQVNQEFFKIDTESEFYKELLNLKENCDYLYSKKSYAEIIKKFIEFKPKVDNFFEKVLIFDEDKNVALNRLRILSMLSGIFKKIAHLEHIQL